MKIRNFFYPAVFSLALSLSSHADIRLQKLFSDNMCLQQNAEIRIWGEADPGEAIEIELRDEENGAVLDRARTSTKDGNWKAVLNPRPAGGPFRLVIRGKNEVEIKNILIGEVWLAGGQSNMWWIVSNAMDGRSITGGGEVIRAATNKQIRIFFEQIQSGPEAMKAVGTNSKWKETSPANVIWASAVGYLFAERIARTQGVPVGILCTAVGGTSMEWWMSREALASKKEFSGMLETPWAKDDKPFAHPTALYNGMIAPLLPFSIRGVVWYQGENNALGKTENKMDNAVLFHKLFGTLVGSWRESWSSKFPFLFVQLAPYELPASKDPTGEAWAYARDAQLKSLKAIPGTAMAVITDCGEKNDIHPRNKIPVAERLALAARGLVYGEKIEYSGPVFSEARILKHEILVSFDHADSGLSSKDEPLRGFEIAGADGKYVSAKALIKGNQVSVSAETISSPLKVRYGWKNFPEVNLFNQEGLPASPFSSEIDLKRYTGD